MPESPEAEGRRESRAPLRLYLTFFAGWVFASVLIVRGASSADNDGQARLLAWFFVAGTGALVAALVNRDAAARRNMQRLLVDRQALIESLGVVTDPRLTQLPLYQLLDDLLERARTVLRAEGAAVYLLDGDRQALARIAMSGPESGPAEVAVGEGVVGRVAASRRGLVSSDVGSESIVAAPLVAEGRLVGALRLATTARRPFTDNDLRLLQVVADRAAVAIDARRLDREARRATLAADGARQRLAMLADAGAVLARPFDRVPALAEALGAALVPSFTDWFMFHELDDDGPPRVVTWHAGPALEVGADGGGDWNAVVTEAVVSGGAVLAWGPGLTGDQYRTARSLELASVLVAPVVVRNLPLGTLTFGTTSKRRGFRPGDIETASDLAARVGVAIERVMLGAETQQSAIRAARHAVQLQRLTEAAFAINATLAAPDLLDVVANQAALVLEADAAAVDVHDGEPLKAAVGRMPKEGHSITSPVTGVSATPIGSIKVARRLTPFSIEDQAILASFAQMASVALANARLYATVQVSETRLRVLYDASPVGIVELEATGRPVRWNRAAETLFGWPAAEPPPAKSPAIPTAALEIVTSVFTDGEPSAGDVVVGEGIDAREVELVAVPLGEGARRDGVVVATVDVTERNEIAEQLQHAQRMEAMARMAGGIAHDFNNVLMVVNGYAELLLHRELDDAVRVDIEAMRAAATRAAQFTRQLLTISRRQVVQPLLVDVGETIRSVRDVLAVMLGSSVRLELVVDDPPSVLIDPAQFEQVVLNLAINAKDAMPKGGTLSILVKRIEVDGAPWAELVVADTGDGMDPVTAEHCFEPFFTTKERSKGTGLGLSTAYGVVTQAGGEITVSSEAGVGTTFMIHLPGTALPATTPTTPSVQAAGRPTDLRILVVDDEPDVRAIVADMLELDGHAVFRAADGPAALSMLDAAAPDVLLTDVVMPEMLGTELAEQVLARRPKTKVILMSSHVNETMDVDDRGEAALFLAKPFSADALAETLRALLDGLPAQGSKR